MITNLFHAPSGLWLSIVRIADQTFAARLARLGLYEGAEIMRLDETVSIGPVKVRGKRGEAVLSGRLAGHIVMHLDDDRRLPLLECLPGSTGHVEGLTGHELLADALRQLGIEENDEIRLVRRMPPMTYRALIDGRHHEQFDEGLASKLLGETDGGGLLQFCSAGVGEDFVVRAIIGSDRSRDILTAMHIRPGVSLVLTSVSSSQILKFSDDNPVVCVSHDGVRLYFAEKDAHDLIVDDKA